MASLNALSEHLWDFRLRLARTLVPRRPVLSRGLRLTLSCDNWITYYRWKIFDSKEPETLDWIDTRMQDGDLFFDVGANIGVYSLYAALRHPRSQVVSFEPEFSNLHLLKENVVCNSLENRIQVYALALSDSSGISFLHLQDLTPGAAFHAESVESLQTTRRKRPILWREGIWKTTLDQFCRESGLRPNCLKIDVDWKESAILQGARETLGSTRLRTLLIELPDPDLRRACVPLLEESGLRCFWRGSQGKSSNEIWGRSPRG